MIVTQGWLVSSGNFAWLNLLTITLAFAAIDDARLGGCSRSPPPGPAPRGSPSWCSP